MLPQTFLIRVRYHLFHHICHLYILLVDYILRQQKLHCCVCRSKWLIVIGVFCNMEVKFQRHYCCISVHYD